MGGWRRIVDSRRSALNVGQRWASHKYDALGTLVNRRVSVTNHTHGSHTVRLGSGTGFEVGASNDEAELMLPSPTDDLDRARADLAMYGLCLVANAISASEVASVRDRVFEVAAEDVAEGRGYDYDVGNQRVWALLNRGDVFVDLVQRDFAIEIVGEKLGRPMLLSNFSGNIAGPGGLVGGLHADQLYVPLPWPEGPLAMNVAWLATDFTSINGATLVVPVSHRRNPPANIRPAGAP